MAGYRDAFDALMSDETAGSPTLASVLDSHRRLYGHAKSAGSGLRNEGNKAKGREGNPETGASWPAPAKIEALIEGLCTSYNQAREEEAAHPLLLAAAFTLDLGAIRPFSEGNGRISRLLFVNELIRHGYPVARYVSIDDLIRERLQDYLEALSQAEHGWIDGEHSIWPWAELEYSDHDRGTGERKFRFTRGTWLSAQGD